MRKRKKEEEVVESRFRRGQQQTNQTLRYPHALNHVGRLRASAVRRVGLKGMSAAGKPCDNDGREKKGRSEAAEKGNCALFPPFLGLFSAESAAFPSGETMGIAAKFLHWTTAAL